MKRTISKNQSKNLDVIKSQVYAFRSKFVDSLMGTDNFHSDEIPLRGIQLLNLGVKIGFGHASWNAFKTFPSNDVETLLNYAHLIDQTHFNSEKLTLASHIKRNYLPDVSLERISSALTVAAMQMPKYRTKQPLTVEGRKLCFMLCENQLRFTKVKTDVFVTYDGNSYSGFFTGFSQGVNEKTGETTVEFGNVYIHELKGVKLVDVTCIKPVREFDCFESYRNRQIGLSYKEMVAGRHNLDARERNQGLVYVPELGTHIKSDHAVIAALDSGLKLTCVALHPVTREVIEVEIDHEFEIERFREMLHDTQELIFCKARATMSAE